MSVPEPAPLSGYMRLAAMIDECDSMVAFTGAGISTECGVPDFRSPDSAWKRNAPIPFDQFLSDEAMRLEAWKRKFAMDDLYAGAQPGRGHAALARLFSSGKLSHIITQNIDGLHQASGVPGKRIIELHGNGTYAQCLDCGGRHELRDVRRVIAEAGAPSVRVRGNRQVGDCLLRSGDAARGHAACSQCNTLLRSFPGDRLIARRTPRCVFSLDSKGQWRAAGDSERAAHAARRPCGPRYSGRYRRHAASNRQCWK